MMGYPKFIVFRVRLLLLAATLGFLGASQRTDSEPDAMSVKTRQSDKSNKSTTQVASKPATQPTGVEPVILEPAQTSLRR